MGFVVSGLTDYVNEQKEELLARLYFEKRSSQYFTPQAGVKLTEALHLLSVAAIPQDGSTCDVSASGSVTFTARNITVAPITYIDKFCMKDLTAKWTQILLRAGNAETEDMQFESQIAEMIMSRIMEIEEVADWQGDTTSGSAFLDRYDGLIKTIDAATVVDAPNAGITAVTSGASGNADTIVLNVVNARIPAVKMAANQVLFCGTDFFDAYTDTLAAKNLYHVDATGYADYKMRIPGKNIDLVGVNGLDGTNRLFAGTVDNFFLGFDLLNDEEDFDMWYEKKEDSIYYRVKHKRGLQIAYPSEIVQFTLAT